jgi:hypothetical protein
MANEAHLLLSCIGDWDDTELAAETWQVGIRLALVFGSVDPVGTLPNNWAPTAQNISRTETHWTITGNWDVGYGPGFHPDDYLNDQAAPAFAAWLSDSGVATSSKCRIREIKLSPIGTDGNLIPAPPYSAGTPCLLSYTSSYPTGATSSTLLPLQNALVMSHRTAQIGRRGRGRVFRPGLTTPAINSHGHVDSSVQASFLSAHVSLLEALSYSDTNPTGPHLRPIVTGSPWTQYGVINSVKVGSVPDTQRRRRRSLPETYLTGTPAY